MRRWLLSLCLLAFLVVPAAAQNPNPPTVQGTLQNAAGANGNGTALNVNVGGWGFELVTFVVTGTFSATINPEGTVDGSNWQAIFCTPVNGGAPVSTFTATGGWRCNLGGGFVQVRARISGYSSGNVTVNGMASWKGNASNAPPPLPLADRTWYASQFPDCDTALSQLASESGLLRVDVTCTVSTTASPPSTLTIDVVSPGSFSIDSGVTLTTSGPLMSHAANTAFSGSGTLTINGPFSAPLRQVFGSGLRDNVTFGANAITRLYVQWFGATGDGSTDDTTALQAAVKSANQSSTNSTFGGVPSSAGKPEVYFPTGNYVVSGGLEGSETELNTLHLNGDAANIHLSAGVVFLSKIKFELRMRGINVRGGAGALSIATANTDTTVIYVTECRFIEQTDKVFEVDNNSSSTLLIVTNSKISTADSGTPYVYYSESSDTAIFRDVWVTARGTGVPFRTAGHLIFRNMYGVPDAGLTAWVDNHNTFTAVHSRFGGESVNHYIVRNFASASTTNPPVPNGIVIRDSDVFTAQALIQFFAIPNHVIITDNRIGSSTDKLFVDATVTAADLDAIGGQASTFVIENNARESNNLIVDYAQGDDKAVKGLPFATPKARTLTSSPITATDVLINSAGNTGAFGASQSGTDTTVSTPTDELGVSSYRVLATADSGTRLRDYTTALNGLSAGVLTAVFAFEVDTDHIVEVEFRAGNFLHRRGYGRGRHVVSIPFYWDAGVTDEESVSFELFDMQDTSQITFTRFYILRGHHQIKEKSIVLSQTAAPVSGQWHPGDTVIHAAAAAGENYAWINVSAGTPGTWVPFGAIQAPNAYTPTNVVTDRSFDADTVAVAELADVVGTLIADLQGQGILK